MTGEPSVVSELLGYVVLLVLLVVACRVYLWIVPPQKRHRRDW